jgi:uncharacterized membrane protein YkvI
MRTRSFFKRFLLPGFAFKAVVIGGGYATGRELAQYFIPSGPWGGMLGMLLAMVLWSVLCAITFLFAQSTTSRDYGVFFRQLLGPLWFLFDLAFVCLALVLLSVFGAAAGAIGVAVFHLPMIAGTLALIAGIAFVAAFGHDSVERLFEYVTIFLYGVYALFMVLCLERFSRLIGARFAVWHVGAGWVAGGATYAAYNVAAAVVILPVLRHLTSRRDALIAGLLSGPLGMWPALVFFTCMTAFYPQIGAVTLPSDYMLVRLHLPVFHLVFQLMILAALLESGTGMVHSLNERLAAAVVAARGRQLTVLTRLALSGTVLIASVFGATRFGLVALIASGYRVLAYVFLVVYVLPLLTYGVWRLRRIPRKRVIAGPLPEL